MIMARLNTKGQLSGGMGPVYYRILNGEPIIQAKPGKGIRQSDGTKASASNFGIASNLAKHIRLSLFPLLQNMSDSYMYTRFTPRIFKAVSNGRKQSENTPTLIEGDFSGLNSFQFNINSVFNDFCNLKPDFNREDDGKLAITVPAFSSNNTITSIESATHCEICYLVTAFDSQINIVTYQDVFKTTVTLNNSEIIPVVRWTTPPLAAGQLVIVTAAVFYFRYDKLMGFVPLNNKQLHPCEIAAIFKS